MVPDDARVISEDRISGCQLIVDCAVIGHIVPDARTCVLASTGHNRITSQERIPASASTPRGMSWPTKETQL